MSRNRPRPELPPDLLRNLMRRVPALERAHSVDEIRLLARSRTPLMAFDFVDGGADAETTMRANTAAFERVQFAPKTLVEVADRNLSTTVMGTRLSMPVILGPAGTAALQHPEGELAVARAASGAGTTFAVSTASSYAIAEISQAAAPGPVWFQVYPSHDPGLTTHLIGLAKAAGCTALVVTVDCPVGGPRIRDLRNGWTATPRLTAPSFKDAVRHPDRIARWANGFRKGPGVRFANIASHGGHDAAGWVTSMFNERLSWKTIDAIREQWPGPLAIKGIMTADDARTAAAAGIDAVVVSNHGGRQLDSLPPTIEVLPEIAAALTDTTTQVLIDSGIRRGSDVAKALALGADAVMIARPWVWGLAAGGEAGVARVLTILRSELDRTLALLGANDVAQLDPSYLRLREP